MSLLTTYAEMLWALSCLTSSSASALFGDALICTVKSAPCAPASPNNIRTSANGINNRCRSLILRKTSVLGLREERFKRMESEIMHEIEGRIKTVGGGVADHVLPRLPARRIARPKSTISALDPQTFSGTTNGARYFCRSMALAAPSLTICSFAGSNSIERPIRYEMLAKCINADERWPSSMSAFRSSRLRLRTALMKFSQLLPPSVRAGPGSCFLPRKVLYEL